MFIEKKGGAFGVRRIRDPAVANERGRARGRSGEMSAWFAIETLPMKPPGFESVLLGSELPALTLPPSRARRWPTYAEPPAITILCMWIVTLPVRPAIRTYSRTGCCQCDLRRAVTDWVPLDRVRSFTVRFVAMTQLHEVVTCTDGCRDARGAGEKRARIELEGRPERGDDLKESGRAFSEALGSIARGTSGWAENQHMDQGKLDGKVR